MQCGVKLVRNVCVVTKNVSDSLIIGNPVKQVGWLSEAGRKFVFDKNGFTFAVNRMKNIN